MSRREVWIVGAVLVLGACRSGGSASSGGAAPKTAPSPTTAASATRAAAALARGSSNVIVEAELATSGVANALEAIQRLRPAMLRGRGGAHVSDGSGTDQIMVYVDGIGTGGLQSLTSVALLNVKEIRYISATDATTRFGTNHAMGAILVSTRKQ